MSPMLYGSIPGIDSYPPCLSSAPWSSIPTAVNRPNQLLDAFVAGGTGLDLANVYAGGPERSRLRQLAPRARWQHRKQPRKSVIIAKGAHSRHARLCLRMNADAISRLDLALECTGAGHAEMFVLHKDDEGVPVNASSSMP